jgi:2-polyprenyl-6-methoxyphenol hydroxylase-like FAD-dependent oxidoreductase
MSKVLVLGGGVVGLSAAMMLKRRGLDVTVLERDSQAAPSSPSLAWGDWDRQGVTQFRQPHILQARGSHILDAELPEVSQSLIEAGCTRFDISTLMPPLITDRERRPGDEKFVTVTGRRPAIEYGVARVADDMVRIIRGVTIAGLVTGPSVVEGIPHVVGVRTRDGHEYRQTSS